MKIPSISIRDYQYQLDKEKIAIHPLIERDKSKLLYYNNNNIDHKCFSDLPTLLNVGDTLVFNDTKVIAARLLFTKSTGAKIEIFCLEPIEPAEQVLAMAAKNKALWKCMIGNLKRFKDHDVLLMPLKFNDVSVELSARIQRRIHNEVIIEFKWDNNFTFSEIIAAAGKLPIPPYLNRETEDKDYETYQTTYAKWEGAVAAPTAGLHFTKQTFEDIAQKGIESHFVTLHVGAGTFKPVKTDTIAEHDMHSEHIIIHIDLLKSLVDKKRIIPVGTTSLRTLESLYWLAVLENQSSSEISAHKPFVIPKLSPYLNPSNLGRKEALNIIISKMESENISEIKGSTEILIMPGYQFKMIDALITNFHQPESTLLVLIHALIGEKWKEIYDDALANDYRFLSYGDSSFLVPNK